MSTSTLQDRVKLALKISGKSKTDLWKGCGVSSSTVTTWVNGRNKSIGGQNLVKAAEILGVNPHWLGSGEGDMHLTSNAQENLLLPTLIHSNQIQNTNSLELRLNRNWISEHFGSSKIESLRLFQINDDTMSPSLINGDFVLVDTSISSTNTDGLYVIGNDKNFLVRRIQQQANGETVIKCDNPAYEIQYIDLNQTKIRVTGRVLWSWLQRKV